jgi:hypothetical protein
VEQLKRGLLAKLPRNKPEQQLEGYNQVHPQLLREGQVLPYKNSEDARAYREKNRKVLAERTRQWRANNPAKRKAQKRRWYWKVERERRLSPERRAYLREQSRKWDEKNPGRRTEISRRSRLKRYGLTLEQYDELLEKQQRCCAICGESHDVAKGKILAVDHDHTTGKVRGLLCHNCNTIIGHAADSIAIPQATIDYMEAANEEAARN